MDPVFQIVSIDFHNPLTGTNHTNQQFLGLAVFSAADLDALAKSGKTLGDLITNIRIHKPEDPLSYAKDIPEMKDLVEGIRELAAAAEETPT